MNKSIYWDINVPLSYNKLFNFIVGQRGNGKTYGAKVWAIKRYKKLGEQFIYLRRYDEEKKIAMPTLLNDIHNEFPDDKLEINKKYKEIIVNGETAGFILALTKMADLKSVSLPSVSTIIYDEFLIEPGVHRYIKNEPRVFLNFYETIARMRDVRVFFLANSTSIANPYFSYFNISMPFNGNTIYTRDEILLQLVMNQSYVEAKQKTRFGSIIKGTDYEEFSVMNKFVFDVYSFVEKPKITLKPLCVFYYMDKIYGLWESLDRQRLWLTKKYDLNRPKYALTNENHEPNKFMVERRNCIFFETMIQYYRFGKLYFDSLDTKTDFIQIASF